MIASFDTFQRSCEHWSPDMRAEMEAFYALARDDYRYLAEAYDWAEAFETLARRTDSLRLIDIACGSGKFPEALLEHGRLASAGKFRVTYDLLDPSAFSLQEARQVLQGPFQPGTDFCCKLQDWDSERGRYDIVFAIHALYCVPAEELETALTRVCASLAKHGFGFVAQGLRDGHYVAFYDQYRESFHAGHGTPYSDGTQVAATLRELGMRVCTREITYTTAIPANQPDLAESYLQRCAFDDAVSLAAMQHREPLAGYLAECRDPATGDYRFTQRVALTLFSHDAAARLPQNLAPFGNAWHEK